MKHSIFCETERLLFKPLSEKDAEFLRLLRNRKENRVWFFDSREIEKDAQIKWYNDYLTKENDYMFSIFQKDLPDVFFGAVALYHYDERNKSFEVGRLILDKNIAKSKGLGSEIIFGATKIAFEILSAEMIFSEVFATNERSLNTFIKNGFEKTDEFSRNGIDIIGFRKEK